MENFLKHILKINTHTPQMKSAMSTIGKALDQYGTRHLWFSQNAGKDNMVCFYLLCLVLMKKKLLNKDHFECREKFPINFVYFYEAEPFDECVLFMKNLSLICNLNVVNYCPEDVDKIQRYMIMKQGLEHIINEYEMKAIILGTRATDPFASTQSDFSPSDSNNGWPEFMRVNPILNWRFNEIWDFLKSNTLAYPTPYDEGYTYLGEKMDTMKNPFQFDSETNSYLPAEHANDNFETFSRKRNFREMAGHKILIRPNEIYPITTEQCNEEQQQLSAYEQVRQNTDYKNLSFPEIEQFKNSVTTLPNELEGASEDKIKKFCRDFIYNKKVQISKPDTLVIVFYVDSTERVHEFMY